MKKLLMTLVTVVMMGNIALAQVAKSKTCPSQRPDKAKHKTEMMAKQLKLDDKQKAKLLTLNQKYCKQMAGVQCVSRAQNCNNSCQKQNNKNCNACPNTGKKQNCQQKQCANAKNCNQKGCNKCTGTCKKQNCQQKQCANAKNCNQKGNCKNNCTNAGTAKRKEIHQAYMKELSTILTPEQMAQFKKNRQNCNHHNARRRNCSR